MLAEVSTAFFVLAMLICGAIGASVWSRLLSPDSSTDPDIRV